MPESFACPSCGAPQHYTGGTERSVRCPFCNNSVIVPEHLRQPTPQQVHIRFHPPHVPINLKVSRKWWLLVLIPVVTVCLGLLSTCFSVLHVAFNTNSPGGNRNAGGSYNSGPYNPRGSGKGSNVALKFGKEGTGPGYFTDARSIAVDGAGRIYVGEYTGGRIQVFDADGKFITQWSIGDRKTILRGMSADRQGNVYVAQGGNLYRYEGPTGKLLDQLQYSEGWGFDDVFVTADGGLVAGWYKNRDDIVRFDRNGRAVRTLRAAISSTSGDSELNTRVAADGMGNIYALGTFNNAVFKFSPDGKFINRFGSAGEGAGQFRAPSAIAVDNQSRVYVSDIRGIQIFDSDGRYLDTLKAEGHAFGMVINEKDELFIAARTQVLKLVINKR